MPFIRTTGFVRSLPPTWLIAALFIFSVTQLGCESRKTPDVNNGSSASAAQQTAKRSSKLNNYLPQLSDYDLFRQPMCQLIPNEGVVEYALNTPLFSDYSQKQRLIRIPPGTSAMYTTNGPLDFPVGTIIAKTFYYSADLNDPSSKRHLVETRILEHREDGWIGIPYVWNEAQTEAYLAIAGASVDVHWVHSDGTERTNSHAVPNLNDCKRCHSNLVTEPIGPKASNLNRDFAYATGTENQLAYWNRIGILDGVPNDADIPKLAVWNDLSTSVSDRARAYLDVNCAHCHRDVGPARNSGLHLNVEETDPYHLGKFKTPVAAGKGTGGRLYGIVPGKPEESIMTYRMQTTQPGEIMPEFGKSLVHEEGLELIQAWIREMQ